MPGTNKRQEAAPAVASIGRIVQCLTGKSSIETITIRIVLLGPVQARRRLFGRRVTFIATAVLKYTALKGLAARSYPMGMLWAGYMQIDGSPRGVFVRAGRA